MSITSDKSIQGQGLREIIDSYNRELMRLHSRSGGAEPASAEPPSQPEPAADAAAAQAPRQDTAARDGSGSLSRPMPEMSNPEREQWLKELESGMEELRKGFIELAKGQKELSDGLNEWREGMAISGSGITAAAKPSAPSEAPLNPPDTDDPVNDIVTHPSGYGTLSVSVNTARQAMPVVGASITVTLPMYNYELLYSFVSTDSSGQSPDIELPVYDNVPVPQNAGTGSSDGYTPEYRTYRVRVQAAGFRIKDDLLADIYSGISSTLTVELEPLSAEPGGRGE